MAKLLISNVSSISQADIIIIGVPDETGSDSIRTGASKGPDNLREIYNNLNYFDGPQEKIPIMPMSGTINKNVYDFGNVNRKDLYRLVFDICSLKKIPIIIGGDHSLTSLALKAISESVSRKISLLYFDAHPDFVSSITDYHGSVLFDSAKFIEFQSSLLIVQERQSQRKLQILMQIILIL